MCDIDNKDPRLRIPTLKELINDVKVTSNTMLNNIEYRY